MKKIITIVVIWIVAIATVNAQPLPKGKHLVFKEGNRDTPFVLDFKNNGSIYWVTAGVEEMYIGKWESLKQIIYLSFENYQFQNFEGLYELIKGENGSLELRGKSKKLYVEPYAEKKHLSKDKHKEPILYYPQGKYLITIYEKGKKKAPKLMPTATEITQKNELVVLQADGEEPEFIAQLQFGKEQVDMQFIPFLSDCSGTYKVRYETHEVFSFIGEKKEITLYPFEPDEIGNREMGITGKWYCKEGDMEITLDFQLPNVVHIVEKQGGFTLDEYSFWGGVPSGEDIFITAVPIFNPFAGTLEQIYVKDNVLHFDYNGKHYTMTQKKE